MRHTRGKKKGWVVVWQSFNTGADSENNRDSALSGWRREEVKCKGGREGKVEQHVGSARSSDVEWKVREVGEPKSSRERERCGLTAC